MKYIQKIVLPNYSYVNIYKMDKNKVKVNFSICKQPKETIDSFYNRANNKPDLISNGGFFVLSTGDTCFTYVDERLEICKSNVSDLNNGFGVINGNLSYGTYGEGTNFTDFISGYPVLIENGEAVKTSVATEIRYKARRTVLAYDDEFYYLIAVESPGLTFSALKTLLLGLKVKYAINLDGGGSTRVLFDGKLDTDSSITNRPVDNVICFYEEKEEQIQPKPQTQQEKTIYRVQVGAFGQKLNAEKLRQKIITLPDTINAGYSKAYVRFIDNLYKVQVGAFSIKENAQKVVADLKTKGIQSFISTK